LLLHIRFEPVPLALDRPGRLALVFCVLRRSLQLLPELHRRLPLLRQLVGSTDRLPPDRLRLRPHLLELLHRVGVLGFQLGRLVVRCCELGILRFARPLQDRQLFGVRI